jgi:hypothetical protein
MRVVSLDLIAVIAVHRSNEVRKGQRDWFRQA